MTLSVVMIARNQELTIGTLIESVLRETSELPFREVVLVDSASADDTVTVALRFPIAVLALPDEEWLCAAAGRYAGFSVTTGSRVLFLDGDMELCEGWLAVAMRALDEEPTVAGVAGRVIDADGAAELPDHPLRERWLAGEPAWVVPHAGGAALYRRAALDEVGCFNPYLVSEEEPELGLRLRERGFEIIALDRPAVFHHDGGHGRLGSLVARRRRRLYLGQGQVVRALLGRRLVFRYLRERGYSVVPALVTVAGAGAAAASAASRNTFWIKAWTCLLGGTAVADAARRRSIRLAAVSFVNRALFVDGLVRGFFDVPGDPRAHPAGFRHRWVRAPHGL